MNLVVSPLSWLVVIGGTLSGGAMYTLANFAWRWKRPTAPAPEFRGRVINYLKWQVPPLLIFVIPIMGFFAIEGSITIMLAAGGFTVFTWLFVQLYNYVP